MKSNKIITANGSSVIKPVGYTKEQQALQLNHIQAWNENEQRLGDRIGVDATHGFSADVNIFTGNAATVPHDAFGQWAAGGIDIKRSMLGIFDDLASAVTRSVDIGVIVDYYAKYSDNSNDVNVTLDGRGKAKTDQNTVVYDGTAIPVIDNNVSFGWRQMQTLMRGNGGGLMRDNAMRNKNRHILETRENMALYGFEDINVGGSTVYGMLTHPDRNTFTHGITIQSATPKEIKAAVVGTLKACHADNFKSGFTVYMNWDDWFYIASEQDALATGTPTATGALRKTIEQELLQLPGVDRIVASDSVPVDTIIALVRDSECVEILDAMPLTQILQFRANTTDEFVFKNMCAQSIQLKSDFKKQMGLAVGSKA